MSETPKEGKDIPTTEELPPRSEKKRLPKSTPESETIKFHYPSGRFPADKVPVEIYHEDPIGNDSELSEVLKLRALEKQHLKANPRLKKRDSPTKFLAGSLPEGKVKKEKVVESARDETILSGKSATFVSDKAIAYFTEKTQQKAGVGKGKTFPMIPMHLDGFSYNENSFSPLSPGKYEVEWHLNIDSIPEGLSKTCGFLGVLTLTREGKDTYPGVSHVNVVKNFSFIHGKAFVCLETSDKVSIKNVSETELFLARSISEDSLFVKVERVA